MCVICPCEKFCFSIIILYCYPTINQYHEIPTSELIASFHVRSSRNEISFSYCTLPFHFIFETENEIEIQTEISEAEAILNAALEDLSTIKRVSQEASEIAIQSEKLQLLNME